MPDKPRGEQLAGFSVNELRDMHDILSVCAEAVYRETGALPPDSVADVDVPHGRCTISVKWHSEDPRGPAGWDEAGE